MFSRVFSSARRILSRSPSAQERSEESNDKIAADTDMVTTRAGTGTGPSMGTPQGSARKGRGKRTLGASDTPISTKRRRGSRVPDAAEIAIPDRTKDRTETPVAEESTPVGRHSSPKVIVSRSVTSTETPIVDAEASTQELVFHTPAQQPPSSVYATPATTRKVQKEFPEEIPSSSWESGQDIVSEDEKIPVPIAEANNLHTRFDSEGPADTSQAATTKVADHAYHVPGAASGEDAEKERSESVVGRNYNDMSDSDEAPEMVTIAAAESKAKAAIEGAARVRRVQQETEEKRRQQRAERMELEQAEKRKRDGKKAMRLAKLQAKQARARGHVDSSRSSDLANVETGGVPALLPDSILEAAGDRRPPTPPPARNGKSADGLRREKLNRHIKFLESGEKPIKDVKKGSVNISVLAQRNSLLTPKANQATRSIRDHWLKEREKERKSFKGKKGTGFKKMERRTVGGSFLRSVDD